MDNEMAKGRLQQTKGFVGILGGAQRLHYRLLQAIQGDGSKISRKDSCTVGFYLHNSLEGPASKEVDGVFTGRPLRRGRVRPDGCTTPYNTLDGKFAIAALAFHEVALFTDAIGAGSIFYISIDGAFFFASHLGLLLEVLPAVPPLNSLGVAAQLYARAQLFDETHFSGVFRLPAGASLTATLEPQSHSVTIKKHRTDGVLSLLNMDARPYGPATIMDLLSEGVAQNQFGEDSVLMLSGGRDSLAIALANPAAPKHAATYGDRFSTDFARGKRRARQLGLKFLPVPYQDWHIGSYGAEIVGLHAGCSGLQTAHNIVGFDWVKSRGTAAVGFLGGTLTGAHAGPDANADENLVLKVLLPNLNDPLLGDVFAEEKCEIKAFVLKKFRRLALEVGARRALTVLELEWRQARWISMMFDLCDWFLPIAYPFFQRELIASSLQADSDMLKKQCAYDEAISRALADRGLTMSMKSFFSPEREAWLASILSGNKKTGRVDWSNVMKRSGDLPNYYFCGHQKLDALTARSWQRARRYATYDFPVAVSSAPISAAVNLFGGGSSDMFSSTESEWQAPDLLDA